jgi:hypothetical protein
MRFLRVLATVAAAGLIAAGCGGDDDDVSEEDFQAAVTEACDSAGEELAGLTGQLAELATDPDAAQGFVEDELIPLFDSLQEDLAEIDAPADQADDYDRLLQLAQEQRDIVADDPAGLFDPDSETAADLEENTAEADELASSLGLPANCGEPGGGASGATGEQGG